MRPRWHSAVLIAFARRWPRPSYAVASVADRIRTATRRRRGIPLRIGPLQDSPEYYRLRVLRHGFRDPRSRWPYPRLLSEPDPRLLEGPLLLATFHLGTPVTLGAVIERLPGHKLAMFNSHGLARPGMPTVDLSAGETRRVAAVMRALATLRAGGVVVTVADGNSAATIQAELLGRLVRLPRGTFAIARMAGAPILPITARWRGRGIEIVTGQPIEPATEAAMAQALADWLGGYLAAHPEQVMIPIVNLLRRGRPTGPRDRLAELFERGFEQGVPDLPVVRPRDRPGRHHQDPAGREADGRQHPL